MVETGPHPLHGLDSQIGYPQVLNNFEVNKAEEPVPINTWIRIGTQGDFVDLPLPRFAPRIGNVFSI